MKASTVITVAAGLTAYTVSAQLDALPTCALTCALSSIGSTGCGQTDIACICSASAFIAALTPCVQAACTPAEFETTIQAAGVLCQSAGVTLSIPTSGAPSTTSEPPSSSVSTSTEMTTASTTETVVEPPVTNSTTTSTETMPIPTNGTTGVTPPTPSGTGGGSAASRNSVAIGGLGALAALVAALL